LEDLLQGKEANLEEHLWTSVLAFEEMVQLLEDARAHAERHGHSEAAHAFEERRGRVCAAVEVLRELVTQDRPLQLDADLQRIRNGAGEDAGDQ
jgi:hypothetical protein